MSKEFFKYIPSELQKKKLEQILSILDRGKIVQYYTNTHLIITDGANSSSGCLFELIFFNFPQILNIPLVIIDPNDLNGSINTVLDNVLSKLTNKENIVIWEREEEIEN